MSGFMERDLVWMREMIAEQMGGTVIIQEATITNTAGKVTETWTAVTGGTVAGRLDPIKRNAAPEQVAGAEGLVVEYQVTIPYDAPDLEVGRRVVYEGVAYEIRKAWNGHTWRGRKYALVSRVE